MKLARGHVRRSWGNPPLLMTAVRTRRTIKKRWGGGGVSLHEQKSMLTLLQSKAATILVTFQNLSRYALPNVNSGITQVICKYMRISTLGKASKDTLQEKFKKLVEKA